MSFVRDPWQPTLNWDTPAGRALDQVIKRLPRDRPWLVNVFGSAPIQMGIEPTFLSADVDVFTRGDWREAVDEAIVAAGLVRPEPGQPAEFYVQCVPAHAFRTSAQWHDRAFVVERLGVTLRFAHPIDVLLGKLNRFAEKDRRAFRLVIERTGHPTEVEMLDELRGAPELLSSPFDRFERHPFYENVEKLWREFFGREIDVEREIVEPAKAVLHDAYDVPDWKSELRDIAEQSPDAGQ